MYYYYIVLIMKFIHYKICSFWAKVYFSFVIYYWLFYFIYLSFQSVKKYIISYFLGQPQVIKVVQQSTPNKTLSGIVGTTNTPLKVYKASGQDSQVQILNNLSISTNIQFFSILIIKKLDKIWIFLPFFNYIYIFFNRKT